MDWADLHSLFSLKQPGVHLNKLKLYSLKISFLIHDCNLFFSASTMKLRAFKIRNMGWPKHSFTACVFLIVFFAAETVGGLLVCVRLHWMSAQPSIYYDSMKENCNMSFLLKYSNNHQTSFCVHLRSYTVKNITSEFYSLWEQDFALYPFFDLSLCNSLFVRKQNKIQQPHITAAFDVLSSMLTDSPIVQGDFVEVAES